MTALDRNYYDNVSVTAAVSLKNTRIGWKNYITDVTASSQATGFPASSLLNSLTYEFWKPVSLPATLDIDLGSSKTCDYLGLGAHELGGCEIKLYYSLSGATYVQVSVATLQDNTDVMLLFTPQAARYWRVEIGMAEPVFVSDFVTGEYSIWEGGAGFASLAVMFLGEAMPMQRMIYSGHTPGVFSRDTIYSDNESEGGQWLGRSIVRQSLSESFSFTHLTPDWIRDTFEPFRTYAETQPFFALWRPLGYANECTFGRTQQDIKPSNTGGPNFMSVSFEMRGYRGA
jgi:hypothetical protein